MLYENYPELVPLRETIEEVTALLIDCFSRGGKLMCAGNGGSAADSEHIVGELMKGFKLPRRVTDPRIPKELAENLQGALPAISLSNGLALPTAFANDADNDYTVAQTLYGLAKPGDVALFISTSGNAKNLANAAMLCECIGVKSIALTGAGGGRLAGLCNYAIRVPAYETYRIQEYHLPVYHEICARVEEAMFSRAEESPSL